MLTTIASTSALRKQLWEKKLFDKIIAGTFFNRFTSDSMNSIVWRKNDLMGQQGDKITFGLTTTDPDDHEGVTGSTTLEGNEIDLDFGSFDIELEVFRQAVRHGKKSKKRASFDLTAEEEEFLRKWYASKLDNIHFAKAYASTTINCYMNSTTFTVGSSAATAYGAVDATNGKLTPALISKAKVVAKTGNGGAAHRIAPIMVGGSELYVLVTSEDTMYDLRQNAAMQTAQRDALERGKNNPIFKGGDLLYDGVLITPCERTNSGTNASSVPYSENLFMGKCALASAWGEKFKLINKTFDYEYQKGTAAEMYMNVAKSKFEDQDYGLINLVTARTDISGS
jgi:N4-gp56 family major capsid protein